ncbi:ABC transporter substrate-binding protein [Bacillus lacus]|uniref:ABC transporter substrate-binding protein n=1 Tax=Metabacillus lacus TaxID=1983721 RepID=A0A7X2J226_9BACI|nr:ABC transporter substrate-binding protein [Metabacillus lacus]MRX73829.1 ABC transporter substrate-binding protein [Metabacillus lacus]
MTKKLQILLAAFLLCASSACSNGQSATTEQPENGETQLQEEKSASYTVKDDRGLDITFEAVPEKIVSLQPSNTEILFALGAGEKIVGVTEYDNYPEEAKEIERISDSMTADTEAILALKPDAVIAYTTGDDAGVQQLEAAGLNVFVIQSAQTFDDVYGDIEQIAAVLGEKENGEKLISDIQSQISDVQEKVAEVSEKEKTYFEISPSPDIYTAGSETFQQEILENAGVENIFADQTGWVKLSEEEIVKRNPDTILTTVNYVENPTEEIKSRGSWDALDAVKNDKVFFLDSDVMSRPGPRIGEAVELAASAVYPELFQ